MPDHHTDVSFAEFVRCADAFSPGPSVGSLEDRSLGALWHACLLLDGVACVSELSQYFDTDTRGRVPFVLFGWLAIGVSERIS